MTYFLLFGLGFSGTFALMLGVYLVRKWWKKKGEDRDWQLHVLKVLKRGEQFEDYETWEENRRMNLK
jgi:hypothetical protein